MAAADRTETEKTESGPVAREEETLSSTEGPRLPIHPTSAHEPAPHTGGPLSMFGGEMPPPEPMEFTCAGKEPPDPGLVVMAEPVSDAIVEALKTVYDPEIPVNIYELGLIYGIQVEEDGAVQIDMTLTAPACPVAGALVREVAEKAASVAMVLEAHVELVWDPPWTMELMTDEAKLSLGLL